jgi:glycosyltransferase involved in cell wall biosynthesis
MKEDQKKGFFILHPSREAFILSKHNIQPPRTIVIDIKDSEEEILARMKPKARYNIRLAEKKGVEYGIRAVSEALKKSQHVEYKIAGDGPLKGKLQSLIAELKVGDKIELVGWKSQGEIADLLEKSDILLAPSVTTENGDEEGIPGVIMEAFAHGLPVVSTCHASIPEVVKDGESGVLVPERDVDGLAEKLKFLIAQPGLRAAMGRKGRDFVDEHYNIEKLNDRLVEIYQGLSLGESPNMAPTPSLSAGLPRRKPVPFRG